MAHANLTDRQARWFASVREGLERDTGRTLTEWAQIARQCPETGHRARLKWLREHHGLLQNRASQVLDAAFPADKGWSDPASLATQLWPDAVGGEILTAVRAVALALPEALETQRKTYTAWSRRVQFAALRPLRNGGAMLGLAVPPDAALGLQPRASESWSERLTARRELTSAAALDAQVRALLEAAWERA
jgi:hypothetical protein